MAGEWVLLENLLGEHGQPVHALAHVGGAHRQIDPHAGGNRDHGASNAPTNRRSVAGAISSATR
ncbi:hypothetical protein [Azospirillum argentinense]